MLLIVNQKKAGGHVTRRTLAFGFCFGLGVLCNGSVSPIAAQARFEEPTREIDFSIYTTPEHCFAMIQRLDWDAKGKETILQDTMPPEWSQRREPWSQNIVDAAQHCSAQWPESTASVGNFRFLVPLYLIAGRNTDAENLITRRLGGEGATRDSAWVAGLDSVINFYGEARPAQLRVIDSLFKILTELSAVVYPTRFKIERLWSLRELAEKEGDSGMAMHAATQAETLFLGLTDEERRHNWYADPTFGTKAKAKMNGKFVHKDSQLDSLRVSSASYIRTVLRQDSILLRGEDPEAETPTRIGNITPVIQSDLWFPKKPSEPRPTGGKISLIVSFALINGIKECVWLLEFGLSPGCYWLGPMLRRINRQFPTVEITVLTYQTGEAILTSSASLAEEAEDLRRYLLDGLKVPAILAVEKADFVQISKPDDRMINTVWTLTNMKTFGARVLFGDQLSPGGILIVDRNGMSLGTAYREESIVEMIRILTRRAN